MLLPQNSNAIITKNLEFLAILALGVVEELSGKANMLSMERDWVPALRASDGLPYDLTHLNSVMRRIDLVCKLVAPVAISLVISKTGVSTGAVVVAGMSAVSWGLEWFCARKVWFGSASLRLPKAVRTQEEPMVEQRWTMFRRVQKGLRRYAKDFKSYFSSTVWIPSMALSLLHFSALSYGAVFVTFLLNVSSDPIIHSLS